MHLIKLDATGSTNAYLKKLWQDGKPADWTVVWARNQYGGRGQKGAIWHSEAGKNLTFSVLKYFKNFDIRHQFHLNMAVSLAVFEALQELDVQQIKVKWPNDIMSGSVKICGILIENIVKATEIRAAVIGIGLNVNQEDFGELGRAASLKTITGLDYKLDQVLRLIMDKLVLHLQNMENTPASSPKEAYEAAMYRLNLVSSFAFPDGSTSNGIIRGISESGKLIVEEEYNRRVFDMKEIQLLN